jgi:GINS complex subunit 4
MGDAEELVEREFRSEARRAARRGSDSLQLLRAAMRNEKGAPELLPFERALVEDVRGELARREAALEAVRRAPNWMVAAMPLSMDLDRTRYLLQEYLRCRLRKIQALTLRLLSDPEQQARLSEPELVFAKNFLALEAEHLKRSVLDKLPKTYRAFTATDDNEQMVPEPDLDTFVLCRIEADVGEFFFETDNGDAEAETLLKGDMLALRYGPIRDLVSAGKAVLL